MKIRKHSLIKKAVYTTAALIGFSSTTSYAASCEFVVFSQWNSGFVANIIIDNDTNQTIDGWEVSWERQNDTEIASDWSANISSAGASYIASNLSWNRVIRPGQSIRFGFVGRKTADDTVRIPEIFGTILSLIHI